MKPTGVTKKEYPDLIEQVFDAYGAASIEAFLELPDEIYHYTAFRTSSMIACLVAGGRRPELLELWRHGDGFCVRYRGSEYRIRTEAKLTLSDTECGNRNGVYRIAYADGDTGCCSVTVKLSRG